MQDVLNLLPDDLKDLARRKNQPEWTSPMLATLTDDYFSHSDWIFERKLDGERCLVFKNGDNVRLMSRNRKQLNNQYPEIATLFKKQKGNFIVDGEIVAFRGNVTSFSKLQGRMHRKKPDLSVKIFYYVFDILHAGDFDLTAIPLRQRKRILKTVLDYSNGILRLTPHRNKEGEKYLEESCKKNREGIIAKDAGSTYEHSRSKKWLKFKCVRQQELVICGYTPPQGKRTHFGALIVGFYDDDTLHYAGKVGTGFDADTRKMLFNKMKSMHRKTSPFEDVTLTGEVQWISPALVGEFRFTEWTDDNKLRHPSYIGLRDDKNAEDVRKEIPGK